MKKGHFQLGRVLFFFILAGVARATDLTTDTLINALDNRFDGADLVISNCTVTMDGSHHFASVQILNGGVLTHSGTVNGILTLANQVTDEPQVLSSANPATLGHTNISTAVQVTDLGHSHMYTNGVDYVTVGMPDGTTQLLWTNTSAIMDGTSVLVSYAWNYLGAAGLTLTVTNDFGIATGGSINVSGRGYSLGFGTGAGITSTSSPSDGSGAGHGGSGGISAGIAMGGTCYGVMDAPTTLGSSGGTSYAGVGGSGGGLLKIEAGGSMHLDGSILANGANATNSRAGGGAGGSIWLVTTHLTGNGTLTANGGAGEPVHGGGGGGGRILLQCGTNNFSGTLSAAGGSGWQAGGAGPILVQLAGQPDFLLVDNAGRAGASSTVTATAGADTMIRSNATVIAVGPWNVGNLTIASNSTLAAVGQTALTLNVGGALALQPGGRITADLAGFAAGNGAGAGHYYYISGINPCSGGSHGGSGAPGWPTNAIVSAVYGSQTAPITFGSGGGSISSSLGGTGGGAIRLAVTGPAQVDGTLSANGGNGSGPGGGGGAGGSIYLTAASVSGNGTLQANGGSGAGDSNGGGGGGGGGRIAVISSTYNFAGTLLAAGGGGANWGGAGTIFYQLKSSPSEYQLILDNDGHAGPSTLMQPVSYGNLIIRKGAVGTMTSSGTFGSLVLASNAWLTAYSSSSYDSLTLTIVSNAVIQSDSGITLDAVSSKSGGPGNGGFSYTPTHYPCGGGSHGGLGGNSISNLAAGGAAYESLPNSPAIPGGTGGSASPYSYGGAGGGVLRLTVQGKLQLDGAISANGGNGYGAGGGGGAGGSLNLTVGTLSGTGRLVANGGNGVDGIGGGGGGGCIAINSKTNLLTGPITAYGGSGATYGGAGTIYLPASQSTNNRPIFVMDNGGHAGAGSIFPGQGANLTLQQGARIFPTYSVTVANLMINSNSWLIFSNNTPGTVIGLTASGDVTVQAGGGINADAAGFPANSGTGAGKYYPIPPAPCSGAGHGGVGGAGLTNTLGGATYDFSSFTTISAGSGGGGSAPTSTGGKGGGVVQLTVSGTLQLDGRLSANGEDGSGSGGGGSGGGLIVNARTLAGTGIIAANGGSGANALGGGGGGGRIALVFSTNTFTGTLTALGGSGANYGGAGVIYWQTNGNNYGSALVDNAGHLGADSSLPTTGTYGLTIQNGGKIYGSGNYSLINLLVGANGSFLVSTSATSATFLTLTVAGDATVQPGGRISGDASGNRNGGGSSVLSGSSPYYSCGGGGHAGYGASPATGGVGGSAGSDSYSSPIYSGGNGGSHVLLSIGGLGGGVIHLNVTGKLKVDGQLSANGGSGSGLGGGGGAGGTLTLNVGSLDGSGQILARGGNGASNGGGGGGGHISVILTNSDSFAGNLSAAAGGGAAYGGAGLIYYKTNGALQSLLIADNAGQLGTNTPVATLTVNDNLTIRNGAVVSSRSPQNLANLLITSNAWLTTDPCPGLFFLLVNQNASIQAGGGIKIDAIGDSQNIGTGRGSPLSQSPYQCSGAGHGGYGACAISNAVAGGTTFDSAITPSAVGSGGGGYATFSTGGSGGGLLNCRVNGSLQLDGTISANGGNGSGAGGGGGSGGGLLLNLNTFTGTGSITANGGNGATTYGGGGGGGRIALYFNSPPGSNGFTGTISAYGGSGANFGGAGTIYYKTNSQSYGLLWLDNADHAGTNTSFDLTSTDDLTIQKGAIGALTTAGKIFAHNLLIRTNGRLTTLASSTLYTLNANAVTIENGGAFTLDGVGYGSRSGVGPGYSTVTVPGGGGHGGYGGGYGNTGGRAYDAIRNPTLVGSGGGMYPNTANYAGGAGGGALTLNAQTLTVNGRLSADGQEGSYNSGGGAGGSLRLVLYQNITGNGRISANGGAGNGAAGGGGGGRISIGSSSSAAAFARTNNFTGQLTASGGGGLYPGGAGTIFTSFNFQETLRVDNGGLNGTNTPLASTFTPPTTPYDLIIAGGATVAALEPLPTLSNLTIENGSTLTMPGAPVSLALAVQHDLNLAGNLTVDGQGYASASGPGAGNRVANQGSGGGYGGRGGASASGAPGGITYGTAAQPVDFGSGGSLGQNSPTGGSTGGGALRVSVGGILTVTGRLSANGNDGWQDDSGGGAGGSLWITTRTLAGTGIIAAEGGDGDLFNGGGGGGGRIAIYAPTNIFTGTTSVSGGIGAENGETGTSFLASAMADWQVLAQSPTGLVSNEVSWVDLTFNEAVDPASIAGTTFALVTPAGPLPGTSLGISVTKLNTVRVSFPPQSLMGDYTLQVSASLRNFFGRSLAAPYAGSFTLAVPVISGTVADTNGAPVAGVTVQPNGSLSSVTTDTSGHYAFSVPPGWTGTVTPAFGSQMFIPGAIAYTNVTSSLTNQNYLLVPTVAPLLANSLSSTNLSLTWDGLAGVTYQAWWSTNLTDWVPFHDPLPGTNGPMQISLPLSADPAVFYRLSTIH